MMSTAAMMLLVSDWLLIAGNYGPGRDGGRHLHEPERRLLDGNSSKHGGGGGGGGSNWATTTSDTRVNMVPTTPTNDDDLYPTRTASQPLLPRQDVHEPQESSPPSPTLPGLHAIDDNDDVSLSKVEGNISSMVGHRDVDLTSTTGPPMLQPLYRVHLDTSTLNNNNGSFIQGASAAPIVSKGPSQQPLNSSDGNKQFVHQGKDLRSRNPPGYMNDELPVRGTNPSYSDSDKGSHSQRENESKSGVSPSTKDISFSSHSPSTSNTSSNRHRKPTPKPKSYPSTNGTTTTMDHSRYAITGIPLSHKNAICEAFQKRCNNGVCVSHILPCPQKACPTSRPFQCGNKWQCVSLSERCDNVRNCEDGTDEVHCDREAYPYSHNRRVIVVSTVIVIVLGMSLFCCVLIHVYRSAQMSDPLLRGRNRRTSLSISPEHRATSPVHNTHYLQQGSTPWSRVLLRLRGLIPYIGSTLEEASTSSRVQPRGAGGVLPSSAGGNTAASMSFHSMGSSVTQPFLPPHYHAAATRGRHLHSETLQSFLSAGSDANYHNNQEDDLDLELDLEGQLTSIEDTEEPPGGRTLSSRVGLIISSDPPPPYEEVVNMDALERTEGQDQGRQDHGQEGQEVEDGGGGYQDPRGPPPTYESIFCIEV